MRKLNLKLLIVCIVAGLLGGLVVTPAAAVTVLWQGPGVNIYLGKPYNSLEFEDPQANWFGKWVQGYRVVDWRDADFAYLPPKWYEDWTEVPLQGPDGNVNEIWLRNANQSASTTTSTVATTGLPHSIVSIHLVGDKNDGIAEIIVDGTPRAKLDMGTWGTPQTALVIVKYLSNSFTHNIDVYDRGIGPSGLGDDVAILGACALDLRKWFPRYWFLNCRLQLYPTPVGPTGAPIPVLIPHGWWGGWWWWHHQCCWLRPWLGRVWWWGPWWPWPWWRYRLYWWYWPYYWYYWPWWYRWRWWGYPYFWGWKKCLHWWWTPAWPWWYWRPYPILYWWGYYWDPEGVGHCVNLVTQSDENEPAGHRIKPVDEELTDPDTGFHVDQHQYSVNGGLVEGDFSQFEWIEVGNLKSKFLTVPGATGEDANDFMESEIVQKLIEGCEGDLTRKVGFEYAYWEHPAAEVETQEDSIFVTEGGDSYTYTVERPGDPAMEATVHVVPSSDDISMNSGPGVPIELHWPAGDTSTREVTVEAVEDDKHEGTEVVMIGHSLVDPADPSKQSGGACIQVTVQDNECGGLGISDGDVNQDCKVDFKDVRTVANDWLACTDPMQAP